MLHLRLCLGKGLGGATIDLQAAVYWYEKAATPPLSGESGEQSPDDAGARQQHGLAAAQFALGHCYQHGYGVPAPDLPAAIKWYRRAAEQQHAEAQCTLGCCYLSGASFTDDDVETEYPPKQGIDDHSKLKEQTKPLAEAAGRRAIELFEAAAAAGVPEAQYNLGWCYLKGQFVPPDLATATRFFEQAADHGDVAA
eukprot:SAG31_NODE_8705_length_1402_cov_1.298542_2_plen_196_part_00